MVHIEEGKQESSRHQVISSSPDAAVAHKGCFFHNGVGLTYTPRRSCRISSTASRGRGIKGVELPQQGFHLALHSFSGSVDVAATRAFLAGALSLHWLRSRWI